MKIPKIDLSSALTDLSVFASEHSPAIFAATGVVGLISAGVWAVSNTPKALDRIDDARRKKAREKPDECFTKMDTVKSTFRLYSGPVILATVSTLCIFESTAISRKRELALAACYKATEEAYSTYREEVKKNIGEKKEKIIQEHTDEQTILKDPPPKGVTLQGRGASLCLDAMSGRYFYSDVDRIMRAQNILNKRLIEEMYISLNELYDELYIDQNDAGDLVGWNVDDGLIDIRISTQLTPDDEPCIVMRYDVVTRYQYLH